MRIQAEVKIIDASEEEREKISKLYYDSKGGVTSVPTLAIFPPTLRFLDILYSPRYGSYDIFFRVGGVAPANEVNWKRHPVDALKELGVPLNEEVEKEMRGWCDEEVDTEGGYFLGPEPPNPPLEPSIWKVGDIVSRTGTDEQKIKAIDYDWGTMMVEVIKPDEPDEEGNSTFKIGDEESNLIERYSFVRREKEIKINEYEKACKEFLKGCSCTSQSLGYSGKQEECPECLKAFCDHLRKLAKEEKEVRNEQGNH